MTLRPSGYGSQDLGLPGQVRKAQKFRDVGRCTGELDRPSDGWESRRSAVGKLSGRQSRRVPTHQRLHGGCGGGLSANDDGTITFPSRRITPASASSWSFTPVTRCRPSGAVATW